MTLTTDELQLIADMLAEKNAEPLLVDRIRHEILTRQNVEPQIGFLVDAYGDTILTRWPVLATVWRQDNGLRQVAYNLAVDCSSVGHAEGHNCTCSEGA